MRGIKRLLILGVSVLTLFSTPVAAGASPVVERISVDQSETMKPGKLISEKAYADEDGNPVTEKVYFTPEKSTSAKKAYATSISGQGTYRKEKTFYIRTSSKTSAKVVAYVEIKANFKNGLPKITSCTGGFNSCPKNVFIISSKKNITGNTGTFSFYAKTRYSKKQLYKVNISINSRGTIS